MELKWEACWIFALFCLIVIAIIAATSLIVWVYQTKLAKPWGTFFGKHKFLWYAVVIALSVAVCVWAGQGIGWEYSRFPNHLNGYLM